MNKNGKKYRRSGIATACYVIAAVMLVYVCYQIGNTVSTINEYYAQYDMSATATEYLTYCAQAALQPFFYALATFMLGYILDAVRKNNKAYYLSDEEVENSKAAKREAREAKKFAKGEAAAAKAGNVTTTEESVEADFARSLDEELKADEKKSGSRGQGGQRKSGGNRRNSSYNNRANNGKGGSNGSGNGGNRGGANRGGANRGGSRKPAAEKSAAKTEAKEEVKFEAKSESKGE